MCGKTNLTRFQETIQYVLQEKHNEYEDERIHQFCLEVSVLLNRIRENSGNLRIVDDVFEFLIENIWYKEVEELKKFDSTVERKLVELATRNEDLNNNVDYSNKALDYLSKLFGTRISCRYDEETKLLIEYFKDSNGVTYIV
jgi:5'-deoxynucleotidase YfbR-like HD superfamily hydrolase